MLLYTATGSGKTAMIAQALDNFVDDKRPKVVILSNQTQVSEFFSRPEGLRATRYWTRFEQYVTERRALLQAASDPLSEVSRAAEQQLTVANQAEEQAAKRDAEDAVAYEAESTKRRRVESAPRASTPNASNNSDDSDDDQDYSMSDVNRYESEELQQSAAQMRARVSWDTVDVSKPLDGNTQKAFELWLKSPSRHGSWLPAPLRVYTFTTAISQSQRNGADKLLAARRTLCGEGAGGRRATQRAGCQCSRRVQCKSDRAARGAARARVPARLCRPGSDRHPSRRVLERLGRQRSELGGVA